MLGHLNPLIYLIGGTECDFRAVVDLSILSIGHTFGCF